MSKEYNPDIVARSFLRKYYDILAEKPEELFRFYDESSFFTYSEDFQPTTTYRGVESIRQTIANLNFKGAQIDLSDGSMDAQKSENNGIVVMVTGFFNLPEKEARRFLQTFVLINRSAGSSFFVGNSMFRLTTEVAADSVPSPAKVAPSSVSEAIMAQAQHAVTAVADMASALLVKKEPVAEPEPEPVVENMPEAEPETAFEQTVPEPEKEVAPVATTPPEPRSYLDIAKKIAAGVSDAPPTANSAYRVSAARQTRPTVPVEAPPAIAPGLSYTNGKPSYSVYVSQIPEATSEQDLGDAFAKFGSIVQIDYKANRGFAFVKFESQSSMQDALAHTEPVVLHGATVRVEERTVSKNPNQGKPGQTGRKPGTPKDFKDKKNGTFEKGMGKRVDGKASAQTKPPKK